MTRIVWPLAAAGFAIITTEFVVVGVLPMMARDLGLSISEAGLFITLFAFTVAASGPVLTPFAARLPRKPLFVAIMAVFALSNVVAAVAPDPWVMAVARIIPATALPVFWALASETAAQVAGPDRSGRAVSMVFNGITVGTVLGIPIGVLLAEALGWRVMFVAIALLSAAVGVLVAAVLPRLEGARATPLVDQVSILKRPRFVAHIVLSGVIFTALFTGYTYLADILQSLGGFSGDATGWILMAFGAFGIAGNVLAGRIVDRSPLGSSVGAAVVFALAMVVTVPVMGTPVMLGLALAVWGTAQSATFLVNQVRVMAAGRDAPAFAASLNVAVCNVGIGLGAMVGGHVIEADGLAQVLTVGPAIVLIAVFIGLGLAGRAPRRSATVPAA